jgi:hypothetical protein
MTSLFDVFQFYKEFEKGSNELKLQNVLNYVVQLGNLNLTCDVIHGVLTQFRRYWFYMHWQNFS